MNVIMNVISTQIDAERVRPTSVDALEGDKGTTVADIFYDYFDYTTWALAK